MIEPTAVRVPRAPHLLTINRSMLVRAFIVRARASPAPRRTLAQTNSQKPLIQMMKI